MIGDISYKNYKKKSDIHGTALYPAVMVAPIQKAILEEIMGCNKIKTVFDPFHGSGTSLYETLEISTDVKLLGCDINPLANLITTVKLQGVADDICLDISNLKKSIAQIHIQENHSFYNITKWFRNDVIKDLTKIRESIMTITNKQNRLYFWYILCDIIRTYSNTRSSTYKLHVKDDYAIGKMKNNVIGDYITSVESNVHKFNKSTINFELFKCDILKKIKEFKDEEVDIAITSPPYGDNATTVTYGQFSMLPLYWIDKNDLKLEGWELDNFSKIDSNSLGGKSKRIIFNTYEKKLIEPYISEICEKKRTKVLRFFNDYFVFIRELCRITKLYIVMTLGNRTVDGVNINLTKITQALLKYYGFEKEQLIERKIPYKRIPPKTSKVNSKSVNSMNFEYVVIYRSYS